MAAALPSLSKIRVVRPSRIKSTCRRFLAVDENGKSRQVRRHGHVLPVVKKRGEKGEYTVRVLAYTEVYRR